RGFFVFFFLFFLAFFGVSLFAAEVLARAGGGGNYRGSSGLGGSGGGGGGGDGLGVLLYLAFAYPEVGVPVLVIVIIASVIKRARNPNQTTKRAVKRLEQIVPSSTSDLGAIKGNDPDFDETRFLDKAKQTHIEVQNAWSRGDMESVRTLLSDGLTRRFETQLFVMKKQGIQNAMADSEILDITIHATETDHHFETIHVALKASSRDVEVDAALSLDEAKKKAAKAPLETYTEIWSFLRKPGVKTSQTGGAVDGY
ncbi:MAG: Tim44 domain-containing protein, partial [Deltaproteobacteria bacterium]|nr:Tim44 domain-containing protein [Deltaproteobacteria bacterium]